MSLSTDLTRKRGRSSVPPLPEISRRNFLQLGQCVILYMALRLVSLAGFVLEIGLCRYALESLEISGVARRDFYLGSPSEASSQGIIKRVRSKKLFGEDKPPREISNAPRKNVKQFWLDNPMYLLNSVLTFTDDVRKPSTTVAQNS